MSVWLLYKFFMILKKTQQKQSLPLDMFYSYFLAGLSRSFLSLNQTKLICWDRSGQMVRRLLFFFYLFHRLQQWQKGGEHLGVGGEVITTTCMSVTEWVAVRAQVPHHHFGPGSTSSVCRSICDWAPGSAVCLSQTDSTWLEDLRG